MSMGKWRELARSIKRELGVYRRVLAHRDTPRLAKMLLGLAVGYVAMPFDLVPDFIPVIGVLDDLVIVPALVAAAMKLVPAEVVRACREAQAAEERG